MIDRRPLRLAWLMMLCLVLVSFGMLYWQIALGRELNPVAFHPTYGDAPAKNLPSDSTQDNQEFIQGVSQAIDIGKLPIPVVQRTTDLLRTIRRGTIYDRTGRELAYDRQAEDGSWERFYAEPSLAHSIGYVSGLRVGVAGLELSYNQTLLGLDRPDAQIDQYLHRPIQGSNLILTIDSTIQRAAEDALRNKRGAIVILDAQDGAVLAMASAPRFDPNQIQDADYLQALLERCSSSAGCQGELINRATQSSYSPGSTWKTIALIAALDSGQVQPGTVFDFGEPVQGPNGSYFVYSVDGGVIPDPNHKENKLDLEMSYAKSANAAFAKIGDQMPADTLLKYARRLGYGNPGEVRFPLEIESTPSQVAWDADRLYSDNLLRAATAIGQGEVLTSPLNVAMVVLSVVNDGRLVIPYFVQSIQLPGGRLIDARQNVSAGESVYQAQTAQTVRQMMITTVEKGTGQRAAIPGMVVGGKTGTAQVGGDAQPHAWFAGFAESGGRAVIGVVMIENGGEGSQVAAPIFSQIAQVAMHTLSNTNETPTSQPTAPPSEATADATTASPTAPPEVTAMPDATALPTEDFVNIPTPEITRDPSKKDITAEDPSCGSAQEVPQATGTFMWPSAYQALSGGDFREGHPGFDLNAPSGSPVYAADTGLVIFAGWSGLGYGNTILIDHGNGFRTLYAHLSQVSTYCGAKVEKGKVIGLSGNTGNSTGPHLHFEVRVPGGYINPLTVLPVP